MSLTVVTAVVFCVFVGESQGAAAVPTVSIALTTITSTPLTTETLTSYKTCTTTDPDANAVPTCSDPKGRALGFVDMTIYASKTVLPDRMVRTALSSMHQSSDLKIDQPLLLSYANEEVFVPNARFFKWEASTKTITAPTSTLTATVLDDITTISLTIGGCIPQDNTLTDVCT